MFRKWWPWIIGLVVLSWAAYLIFFLRNDNEDALVDAKIPEETKQSIRDLSRRSGEFQIDFVTRLKKKDYNNDSDIGQDPVNNYLLLEDDNFIIYFRETGNEEARARKILESANQAVLPLKSFFGHYFYPNLVNGRKLVFYLAPDRPDYNAACSKLGNAPPGWSAAVTYMIYGEDGQNMCKGIVLSEQVSMADVKRVTWHEMTHFTHLQSLNLTLKRNLLDWECEGIAGYFAGDNWTVPYNPDMILNIDLTSSTSDYTDSYWIGLSVFTYFKTKYGESNMRRLIQDSYDSYIVEIFPLYTSTNFTSFQSGWKRYCNDMY